MLPRSQSRGEGKKHMKPEKAEKKELAKTEKKLAKNEHPEEKKKLKRKKYEKALSKLQLELVKLQYWVKREKLRVVVLFEGRDAAGKGGAVKRIAECLNPRGCRVVALGTPTDREKSQWYFQRYVEHLPAAGEIVLFDRSWYNRGGVEKVMGFCTDEEHAEFLQACPVFERMLLQSGVILVKYWFSVSDEIQEQRFRSRSESPAKRWKLSPMDLEARTRFIDYSKAKDTMFLHTDVPESPWWVVDSNDQRAARLNCIAHLLERISYEDLLPTEPLVLPPLQEGDYDRPPIELQRFVPARY
ncbi:MAG: polyphosphate kinase 2 [Myxococcales bacterium]|nr:polyphosphate kinase 2 [Myxococcales bacterium]